jgi:hypothetical protein
MSVVGQKQTSAHVRVMSALPPKADIGRTSGHVRFVPIADITGLLGQRERAAMEARLDRVPWLS